MKKIGFVIVGIFVVAVAAIFFTRFLSGEDDWICENGSWIKHGNPSALMPTEQCGEQNTQPITSPPSLPASCKSEPEGQSVITSLSSYSGSIGTSVGTKFEIKGCNFSGFEGDKYAWIENAQGVKGILGGGRESTDSLLKITLRSSLCQFDNSYSGLPCNAWLTLVPGTYKIYVMPWGKKSNEVIFTITAGSSQQTKAYFFNEKIKPLGNCNGVVPVYRFIEKTSLVATAALNELLEGPTAGEKAEGYTTNIPVGSSLNSLVIENGMAKADFNETTETGGGSCSMAARTAQIRLTLLQFPTVKEVILSINGRTEDIFQP